MRVKSKEWLVNTKYTSIRRRVKRIAHKQERRLNKEEILREIKFQGGENEAIQG